VTDDGTEKCVGKGGINCTRVIAPKRLDKDVRNGWYTDQQRHRPSSWWSCARLFSMSTAYLWSSDSFLYTAV